MRKLFWLIAFVFCVITIQAQTEAHPSKPLIIGEIQTITSSILHEERTLNIYLPPGYAEGKDFPVLYVLDGSMHEDFLHIVGLVQFFNMQFRMPEIIVVGIANVDRKRDFTFHTDLEDLQRDFPTTGHSDAFIAFIADELQPFIESTYKTNQTKYIIGQSLGGLLATEILLKQPGLFSHYLIVSPSLWWDNESLLQGAEILLEKQDKRELFVYIAVGKDEDRIMRREAYVLKKLLEKSDFNVQFNEMHSENHATILHNTIYDAFMYLFPYQE